MDRTAETSTMHQMVHSGLLSGVAPLYAARFEKKNIPLWMPEIEIPMDVSYDVLKLEINPDWQHDFSTICGLSKS